MSQKNTPIMENGSHNWEEHETRITTLQMAEKKYVILGCKDQNKNGPQTSLNWGGPTKLGVIFTISYWRSVESPSIKKLISHDLTVRFIIHDLQVSGHIPLFIFICLFSCFRFPSGSCVNPLRVLGSGHGFWKKISDLGCDFPFNKHNEVALCWISSVT